VSEHAAQAALPQDELERLREQAREETRRAVALDLQARFQGLWNDLAAERDSLAAEVGQQRAGRNGTCPQHEVALVAVCPACLGEAPRGDDTGREEAAGE
jgi:hypothetical protein